MSYQYLLNNPDITVREQIRTAFPKTANRSFTGWKGSFDRQFDESAKWFASYNQQALKTALRIIIKTDTVPLPLECASTIAGPKLWVEVGDVEISGVHFPTGKPEAIYPVLAEVLHWIRASVNGRCFAIADARRFGSKAPSPNFFKTLYQDILQAKSLKQIMVFKGITPKNRLQDAPVEWLAHEIPVDKIPAAIDKLLYYSENISGNTNHP